MKCYSLFSGIGGFDLALARNGHEVVGACEIDKYARQIYEKHFTRTRIEQDATKLEPERLPEFELLCAGFPCQAFSVAGKRLGFEESRGTLFYEIARIAKTRRPRILLLENVKGLLSHDRGKTFAVILSTLDELGYDAEWQVLNSKYFVPQNRERIFIIGYLRGESRSQVFPIRESSKGNDGTYKEKQRKGKRIWSEDHTPTITARDRKGTHTVIASSLQTTQEKGTRTVIATPVLFGHRKQNGRNIKTQDEPTFTVMTRQDSGIMIRDGRDNRSCLRAGRTPELGVKGISIRRLTPLECERLQGFPDGWTEGISDNQRYKCLGNAVTVPVVEYIVSQIK